MTADVDKRRMRLCCACRHWMSDATHSLGRCPVLDMQTTALSSCLRHYEPKGKKP